MEIIRKKGTKAICMICKEEYILDMNIPNGCTHACKKCRHKLVVM